MIFQNFLSIVLLARSKSSRGYGLQDSIWEAEEPWGKFVDTLVDILLDSRVGRNIEALKAERTA